MDRKQLLRIQFLVAALIFTTIGIVGRLYAFQIVQGEEWRKIGDRNREARVTDNPERGLILDRHGAVLAANDSDYQVGASPNHVDEKEELATALAPILEENRQDILAELNSDLSYVILAGRVGLEVAETIRALSYNGVNLDPLPRRFYPQGHLASHILGYVDYDGVGGSGLEAHYQPLLAGEAASAIYDISPLSPQPNVVAREGADIVLTIDRSIQHLVERHLAFGIREHVARSGTIIVMDPRSGAILAMASYPDFDPNDYFELDNPSVLMNPAVTGQYEPGSIMKLITMAAALDSGTVTPQSTYYDAGILDFGGNKIYNWDKSAPGETDMETLLARSLNIGAATLAMWMGPENYYEYMAKFNFGRPTGTDLSAEMPGLMPLPGSELWTEASLATNAFGQGLATTPLQMVAATSALANEGRMMQPYLVEEIRRPGEEPLVMQPRILSRPVSEETARQLTAMAVNAVHREVQVAQVEGYTVAGKTGTAQIAENGIYLDYDVIGSFIGWLPADDPEIIVLVKIDRPQINPWGSQTAAPLFSQLVTDLVTLLNIPPDHERLQKDIYTARNSN